MLDGMPGLLQQLAGTEGEVLVCSCSGQALPAAGNSVCRMG